MFGTYLNAYRMVIPNVVTKFQNFDIFETFVKFLTCRLLTPAVLKVLKRLLYHVHFALYQTRENCEAHFYPSAK